MKFNFIAISINISMNIAYHRLLPAIYMHCHLTHCIYLNFISLWTTVR